MSIVRYPKALTTDGDGDASVSIRAGGCRLLAVEVDPGTLEAFDLTVTDEPSGRTLLAAAAIEAAALYQPMAAGADPTDGTELAGAFAPAVVTGRIEVAIANGGDTLTGSVTIVVER